MSYTPDYVKAATAKYTSSVGEFEDYKKDVSEENALIEERVDTMEKTVRDFETREKVMNDRIDVLESSNKQIELKLMALSFRDTENTKKIIDLQEEALRAECYSRRQNLRIFGLAEKAWEKWDDTAKIVTDFLVNTLGIPPNKVIIERAHRIGPASARKPRPIIARLLKFEDKFEVLKKRGNLKDTKIRLEEDFPIIIVERRRKLMPSFQAIKKHNATCQPENRKVVKLAIDKLHIDGVIFTHDTAENIPYPFAPLHLAEREIGDSLYFYTQASPLSNHHPCNFVHQSVHYSSSEQYFFTQKAIMADDDVAHNRIMKARNAMQAMTEGKRIKVKDENTWEKEAKKVMLEGLYQKFSQSQVLKRKLMATDGFVLCEASLHMYWGIGIHIRDSDLGNLTKQIGQNVLGELLMEVRGTVMGIA